MSPTGVEIKCRYRRSPRSIDPEFDACIECVVGLNTSASASTGFTSSGKKGATLQITPVVRVRQRSFNHPPIPSREDRSVSASRRRNRSVSVGRRKEFSAVDAIGLENESGRQLSGSTTGSQLELCQQSEEGGSTGASSKGGSTSPPRNSVAEGRVTRETDGLPPITPFNPKRDASPLIRENSNLSGTPSQTRSDSLSRHSSRSRSHSRSRSRSQVRNGTPMIRKRSMGAHAAFAAFADAEIDGGCRSRTPLKSRGCSIEEEVQAEPLTVPLADVVSVDQEIPYKRKRSGSAGSDFFSSVTSETASSGILSPPEPSDSYHGKSALYRIFIHTATHGYIEFSFDNQNSNDILMAFLSAHLKTEQLPRKAPNNEIVPPVQGALQTMVLTPTKKEEHAQSNNSSLSRPLKLTRSNSTESTCTLDKLQKKMIQQRIQQESTPLQKIQENLATWMSSIVDCACCQDTTVAPEPEEKNVKRGIVPVEDASPASKLLKRRGIGGLSFEESSARLSPRLSFEKSVATDNSSRR